MQLGSVRFFIYDKINANQPITKVSCIISRHFSRRVNRFNCIISRQFSRRVNWTFASFLLLHISWWELYRWVSIKEFFCSSTGSPSSKYKHRRPSTLLHNIRNIGICMGKKPIVSVTYENERISIKKQLRLHKMCVTSLLCDPWADLWLFYGLYRKRFSLYIKAQRFINI